MQQKNKESVSRVSTSVGGQELIFETGRLAKQANGSVLATYGESVILATAVMSEKPLENVDFFPLTVDYEENYYAAGKVRGSRFMKRKGKPTDESILTGRLIDRSIRPFFPDGMRNEVQIILTALSFDRENDPEFLALAAACAAIAISDIPLETILAGVKIGLIEEKLVLNPKLSENGKNNLDITAVFTKEGKVAMLEAGAREIPEKTMLEAIKLAQKESKKITALIEELREKAGKNKKEVKLYELPKEIYAIADKESREEIKSLIKNYGNKLEFEKSLSKIKVDLMPKLISLAEGFKETKNAPVAGEDELEKQFSEAIDKIVKEEVRALFIKTGKRIDQRKIDEIRPLQIEVGILPRTHGSAVFARGFTQGLTATTLGSPGSALLLDGMEDNIDTKKHYMHFYSFPPYSTGECRPLRGPGRREIGHGALGEKALIPVIPDKEKFPYTIVMHTEIMESDGSTSMASVCGSTLALMDAGVPIKKPVAGIAMGLMYDPDKDKYTVLTDLCAMEDFSGYMDFKAAGTNSGITAIQMDIKLKGLPLEVITDALSKSLNARLAILKAMAKVIAEPKKNLSPYAPRVEIFNIPVDKIRDVIGPGGKVINDIIDKTGVTIDIEQDGTVSISSEDEPSLKKAVEIIKELTKKVEVGEIYTGKVVKILDFGAFVELTPNQDGMVHISQIKKERVENIRDHLKEGDEVKVKVRNIDAQGRVNLTMLF
ncbi:MAG: polyribonucleotide nucleotidyltransferase [Candidatus Moranbacteria bacterium]|nr:polyribonucleotide nucleotidyltransferase [Candidatus Moranbacteria bacterium]